MLYVEESKIEETHFIGIWGRRICQKGLSTLQGNSHAVAPIATILTPQSTHFPEGMLTYIPVNDQLE